MTASQVQQAVWRPEIAHMTGAPVVTDIRGLLAGASIMSWAFGTWLIPPLVAAGWWRTSPTASRCATTRPGGVSCSRWACTGWADNYLGQAALDARQRFQLAYWDTAIIEASRAMGFTQVLSEDLNDGPDYGDVQVTNPFR